MKTILLLFLFLFSLIALSSETLELLPVAEANTGSIKAISSFGGDLYLDGVFVQSLFAGATAVWSDIPAGLHDVELRNAKGSFLYTISVNASEESVLNFDAPPPAQPRNQAQDSEQPAQAEKPATKPFINSRTFGFATLEIYSELSGDIYLGGEFLGRIVGDESKKFKQVPAGQYSLELFSRNSSQREDVELNAKSTLKLSFLSAAAIPYAHEMVYIPAGKYFMGTQFINRSEYERPRHEVSLPPFLMGSTEVTQALWQKVMGSNPSVRTAAKQPVTNVSWYRVLEFCNQLSLSEGLTPCYKINKTFPDANNSSDHDSLRYSVTCNWKASGYRLPTEAEWEYAARCGDSSNRLQYSGGSRINEVGWCEQNSGKKAQEVAQLKANDFGLYDMSGNVFEWCWDWWAEYEKDSVTHPKGSKAGTYRVIRGGSWQNEADQCSSTARGGNSPDASAKDLGFRLVRNAIIQ